MPLGIVSDNEFLSELNNSNVEHIRQKQQDDNPEPNGPTITSDVLQMPTVGRIPDVTNVPEALRKVLGEEVATNGLKSAMQLAEALTPRGLSQPTLSTYARGESSPGNTDNDLTNYINSRKTKIGKRALNKLNQALLYLDDSKLRGCDAKELSSVAKDMAHVAKAMEPDKTESAKSEPVQFHFYAPQVRQENHYETVTAKDNY